jgi:hypothetical protein
MVEPSRHAILVKSRAGVWETQRRLLHNGILECEIVWSTGMWPHVVKFYAPADFDLSFLRPDILPPKDYVG